MIYIFSGAMLLSCASVLLWKREIDIIKCAALGTCFYFCIYVFVTAGLFWINSFSLLKAVTVSFLCFIVIFVAIFFFDKDTPPIKLHLNIREHGLAYLITLLLVLSLGVPFGYFGMGQDQGVYQTETINLMYGRNEWHTTITEYEDIEDEEYREYFFDSVKAVLGMNFIEDRYDSLVTRYDDNALEGIYHGIPTFPATMALAGVLFGLENMMFFQMVFYAISLLLIEYILYERRVSPWIRGLLLAVFGISPQVMWVAKSAFTESFLAVLVLLYLYFILQDDFRLQMLSAMPIVAFCFYHISAFSMFPVFIVNYWFLFLVRKDTRYLKLSVVAIVGLMSALCMEFMVVPIYTINNFSKLFEQHGISIGMKWIPLIMLSGCLLLLIISEAIRLLSKINDRYIHFVANIVYLIMSVVLGYFFAKGYPYFGFGNFPYLIGDATITAYVTLSGFLLMPIIYAYHIFFIKRKKEDSFYLVTNFYIYAVVFYSMVLRPMVLANYYYNTRYIMPYLGIIIVLYGCICGIGNLSKVGDGIEERDRRAVGGRVSQVVLTAVPVIGICMMLPFSAVVRDNQDDTNVEWDTLKTMMSRVGRDATVLMDADEMMWFYYPLRATGAHIYPILDSVENARAICDNLSDMNNLYYLSQSQIYEDDWQYEVAYEDKSRFQLNDGGSIARFIMWPTAFTQKGERTHILYRVAGNNPVIDAADGYFISGWSNNSSGHRWMNDIEASFYAYLYKNDYMMGVKLGDRIPFELISIDEIKLDVYVNDIYVMSVNIEDQTSEFEVDISADIINEGKNTITFKSEDMWSPSEYGSMDTANYSVSVDTVRFVER